MVPRGASRRTGALPWLLWLLCVVATTPIFSDPPATDEATAPHHPLLLLDERYPIEIVHPFHTALFHWIDSLIGAEAPGLTAGKTVRAHRLDYAEHHAGTDDTDIALLKSFHEVRLAHGRRLTDVFFEAPSMNAALQRARAELPGDDAADLERTVRHFGPRYRPIWNQAAVPRRFVRRCVQDPQRQALAAYLVNVARFYAVSPTDEPRPRLVVVPVRDGYGTHAQAIGRHLLIEVRPWEGLTDEVAPIVHENAHFLFSRIPKGRRDALREVAFRQGGDGLRAWNALREALPTAIAQGVAAERFMGDRWSRRSSWYHIREIDRYAKKIFPIVRRALRKGGVLDDELLVELIAAYPGPVTRR